MLENVLTLKNVKVGVKVTVKTVVAVCLIACAVGLPQLVHLVAGSNGGMRFLPMYLPVLIAGLVLGKWWGLGIGVLSPVVSFLITLAVGSPMPALERLPFMMAELAVFAFVSGLFSKSILKNNWIAFPATLLACVAGRSVFMILALIFESVSGLPASLVWTQIQSGLIGLVLQAVIVPVIVILISKILTKENANDRV